MELYTVLSTFFFLLLYSSSCQAGNNPTCPHQCNCSQDINVKIDCSNTHLKNVPDLSQFKDQVIEELNLSNNKNLKLIQHGAFEGLNISILKLSATGLTKIKPGAFSGVVGVNTLYLDRNNLVYLDNENPLAGLEHHLEYLILKQQHLDDIPSFLRSMRNLIEVDLSENNIQEINDNTLRGISARRLLLQNNHLHTISESAFLSTSQKELVDLSNNNIQDISFLWDYCKFGKVDLRGNPIYCMCNLVIYRKAMTAPQVLGTCASPEKLAGVDVNTEEFLKSASFVCRIGGVTPITCPAPHYRGSMYTNMENHSGSVIMPTVQTSASQTLTVSYNLSLLVALTVVLLNLHLS